METKIITRKEYMSGLATHDEYYESIANELGLKYTPEHCEILEELLAQSEMKRDSDPHLNSIPLYKWDAMGLNLTRIRNYREILEKRGDFDSMAVRVCIIKAGMGIALRNY
jgi:hypothetical protein